MLNEAIFAVVGFLAVGLLGIIFHLVWNGFKDELWKILQTLLGDIVNDLKSDIKEIKESFADIRLLVRHTASEQSTLREQFATHLESDHAFMAKVERFMVAVKVRLNIHEDEYDTDGLDKTDKAR